MAMRKATGKRTAAKKVGSKKVARSSRSRPYTIFDSPLEPKHFSQLQIRRAVKAA